MQFPFRQKYLVLQRSRKTRDVFRNPKQNISDYIGASIELWLGHLLRYGLSSELLG